MAATAALRAGAVEANAAEQDHPVQRAVSATHTSRPRPYLARICFRGSPQRPAFGPPVSLPSRYNDAAVSPVIRQTLLHWAFEVSERDVLEHAGKK